MTRVFYMIIVAAFLAGCSIKTPEIQGVVLDEETKQPVEGAWVNAELWTTSRSIAGDVSNYLSVAPPHTRTDKNGKFIIPSKTFGKSLLGTKVENFAIGARTADWRGGGEKLNDRLGKNKIDLTIYISSTEREDEKKINNYLKEGVTRERAEQIIEGEYFASLQALHSFCLTGRQSVEVPAIKGGCDDWELDYAIKKHEWFLEKYKDGMEGSYYAALDLLADLYYRKGDVDQAVNVLRERISYIQRHDFLRHKVWKKNQADIEAKIERLKDHLE